MPKNNVFVTLDMGGENFPPNHPFSVIKEILEAQVDDGNSLF